MTEDGKVHSLFGGPTGVPEVRPHVVEVLEEALERARSGDVAGIALVTLDPSGLVDWRLTGAISFGMVGGLSCVHQQVVGDMNDA